MTISDEEVAVDAGVVSEAISKRYGSQTALAGISLEVPKGSVLALLGPNGAGKTTLVRVLTTLTRPDAGRAVVAGHDVVAEPSAVRQSIGLVGQHTAVDEYLTGRENLMLVARLLQIGRAEAHARAAAALDAFGLHDAADATVATYSGGMRRRLDIAVTLLTRPAVVFLDEPTTGLDPASRRDVWRLVQQLAADGTTILLTTQYLEEADRLADTVAVIDRGRLIATGTPGELKARLRGDTLHIRLADPTRLADAVETLRAIPTIDEVETVGHGEDSVHALVSDGAAVLPAALRHLDARDVAVTAAEIRRPDLDDVFLALTGQAPAGPDPTIPARRRAHAHQRSHA
ncbi:MAG TPA: ATP-binding cassette domain-containing protein [Acidimicrobiales bacterium]|nr:ATP-binding cassette domain-containing protein [Acidimicrobiales bacterium]